MFSKSLRNSKVCAPQFLNFSPMIKALYFFVIPISIFVLKCAFPCLFVISNLPIIIYPVSELQYLNLNALLADCLSLHTALLKLYFRFQDYQLLYSN